MGISDTLRDKYYWFLGVIILLCKCPVELRLYQRKPVAVSVGNMTLQSVKTVNNWGLFEKAKNKCH